MFGNYKRSYGPFVGLDFVFILLGVTAVVIIFQTGFDARDAQPAAGNPWLSGTAVLGMTVLLSWAGVVSSKLDQRLNDEFTYRAVTNGAVVALFVALLTHLAFDILPMASWGLGSLNVDRYTGILMGGWSIGYGVNRVRGTVA